MGLLGREPALASVSDLLESAGLPPAEFDEERGGMVMHLQDRGEMLDLLPEELMAFLLTYAQEITESFYGVPVKDAVLTVPEFWTATERQALLDAAELSGLRVLLLIDENTAAAIQFAIDRAMDEDYNVLFYNMGAGGVQASIVTFGPKMDKGKNVGQLTVKSKAWDESLGGHWFNVKVVDMLIAAFKKSGGDEEGLRSAIRGMAKLRSRSGKVKEVLSANLEIPVTVEGLHEDKDLTTILHRPQFEVACADLFERVTAPIEQALQSANMTVSDIHAVEIVGGGVRVPKVQSLLRNFLNAGRGDLEPLDLGVHLNGDEAMALGAAFAGANVSRAFHVRQVGVTDMTPFGVSLELGDSEVQDSEETYYKKTELYAPGTALPFKKVFTITHAADMQVNLTYTEGQTLPGAAQIEPRIASFSVEGIAKFAEEMEVEGKGVPKVALRFATGAHGIPALASAEAYVEYEKEVTYTEIIEVPIEEEAKEGAESDSKGEEKQSEEEEDEDTVAAEDEDDKASTSDDEKEAEGGEDDADAAAEGEDGEGEGVEADEDAEQSSKSKSDKKKDKKKKEKKPKTRKETVTKTKMVKDKKRRTLTISKSFEHMKLRPMNDAQKKVSSDKLGVIMKAEAARKQKEQAKNDLETYILRIKNAVIDDEANLATVSTDEQRNSLVELANQLEEWLYDEGWDEEASVYQEKYSSLSQPAEAIFDRLAESELRPKAVSTARAFIAKVREAVEKWENTKPHITEEERGDVMERASKAERWLEEREEEQAAKAAHEEPAFRAADVEPQLQSLKSLFQRIKKKPEPKPEEPEKSEGDEEATATDGEGGDGASEEGGESEGNEEQAEGGEGEGVADSPEDDDGDADADEL
jgi:hypoxia up-regulated 1